MKIFVVDDNPNSRNRISNIVHKYTKHSAALFSSGRDVLDFFKKDVVYPDLVLLDILMPPGINGFDVAKFIRKTRPLLPIIFITALADPGMLKQMRDIGCTDCLIKPFGKDKLLLKMQIPLLLQETLQECKKIEC